MARTRRTFISDNGKLTAAALPLAPKSPIANDYTRTLDYIINLSDGSDETAWAWYRSIPELHYLVSLMGNALSMVNFYVAEIDSSTPDNPKEVGPRHPAKELMRQFAGGDEGQQDLVNRLAVHLTVAGDSVLIGPAPTSNLQYPYDQWRVYSTSEVSSRNGKIFVKGPSHRDEIIPPGAMAIRIWKQSPQEWWKADSPVKACFTVLREIDLLNQHVHASAISRLKGSGILVIPEEMTLPTGDIELEGIEVDPFVAVLTEVMALAIKNRDSAAALVPIILRGPAEFIDAIRHIDFSTTFDEMVPELRNNALRRLALGMDAPPEILLGSAESSSWSMWQISEAQLRLHIKPLAFLIAGSLTEGWLKPSLEQIPLADQTREGVDRLVIWPDFSRLNIRPDVGQDAAALYEQQLISDEAYRHILGLGDNEKPDKKQFVQQVLMFLVRSNPQLAPYAIKALKDDYDYPFPGVDEALAVGQPPQPEQPLPGFGTPAKPPEPGTAPRIPGQRSIDKQTGAPKPPPIDGDSGNNQGGNQAPKPS